MVTSVKKIVIWPVYHLTYSKRIETFLKSEIDEKKSELESIKPGKKHEEEREKAKKRLDTAIDNLENFQNGVIEQSVLNDYAFTMVRKACKAEAMMKNIAVSKAYEIAMRRMNEWERNKHKVPDTESMFAEADFKKETQRLIRESFKECTRKAKKDPEKMASAYDGIRIDNVLEGYGFAWSKVAEGKFWDQVKKGLLHGNMSISNYKDTAPFTIAKSHMGFSSDYETPEETIENLDGKANLYFDYGSNQESTICNSKPTVARFKLDLGHSGNKNDLLSTMRKLYSGECIYCGSSIKIEKNKIILLLTVQEREKEIFLDDETIVGVDIGVKIPAYCALNNMDYRKPIGNGMDFLAKRNQMKAQRERAQSSAKFSRGGHGRKRKLAAFRRFSKHEENFKNNYNHKVAKEVVKFAIRNKAKYIHIESLEGISENSSFLKRWPYYDLQTKIIHKAGKYGIVVRKVNPCYTSQICSKCGFYSKENRESQEEFICKRCGEKTNADYNASRNIAKIPKELILKDDSKKKRKTMIEEARKAYGIKEDATD